MTNKIIKKNRDTIKELRNILRDEGLPQDSAGNSRLTLFADKIKLLQHSDPIARNLYIEAINDCAKILSELSVIEVNNLCNLINLAEILPYEFHDEFLLGFKEWQETPYNVEQRAEIFRLIGESGSDMEVDFISHRVGEIKKAFPWYWIDVAMYLDRDAAISEIKEFLKANRNYEPILNRLSHWWDLYKDKEEYFGLLSLLLEEADLETKKTVRLLLESFGILENRISKIFKDGKIIPFIIASLHKNKVYHPMCASAHTRESVGYEESQSVRSASLR